MFVANYNDSTVRSYRANNFAANSGSFTDRVGIGTTSPAYALQLSTDSAAKPTTNTWTISSDARMKTVLGDYETGLSAVKELQPKRYRLNGEYGSVDDGRDHVSVIAQEVQADWPGMVGTYTWHGEDGEGNPVETELLNLNTNELQWALVNAAKELSSKVDALTARLEAAGL